MVLAILVVCTVLLAPACARATSGLVADQAVQTRPGLDQVSVTTNPAAVRGCAFVNEVKGAERWSAGLRDGAGEAAEKEAVRELKQRAADAGADTVLLVASTTERSDSSLRAEAYRCSPPRGKGGL